MAKDNAFPADPNWIEPCTVEEGHRIAGGMSMRQYYAGEALSGIVANPNFFGSLFQQNPLAAAQFAVECADHLIAELSKGAP